MSKRLFTIVFIIGYTRLFAQEVYIPTTSSEATFVIKNLGVSVNGKLDDFFGKVFYDHTNVEKTTFDITIPVKTLETGIDLRDKHLRKAEYFDLDQYPTMHFSSTSVAMNGSQGVVKGILTIKKTSRPVEVLCTMRTTEHDLKWEGSFEIDRRDFDVGGRSFSMGDTVRIKVVLVCVKS